MSSRQRRRHGRPPPALDPDRRFTSSQQDNYSEYDEIQSIQRQAAALNARVAALTTSSRPSRHKATHRHQDPRPSIVSCTPPNFNNIQEEARSNARKVQTQVLRSLEWHRRQRSLLFLG